MILFYVSWNQLKTVASHPLTMNLNIVHKNINLNTVCIEQAVLFLYGNSFKQAPVAHDIMTMNSLPF